MAPGNAILAAMNVDLSGPTSPMGQSSNISRWLVSDVGIVVVVGLVLALLLFGWAKYVRRPSHRAQGGEAEPPIVGPTRRRKVRSEHRPRKPTLAETGGLPPMRDANSAERPPSA